MCLYTVDSAFEQNGPHNPGTAVEDKMNKMLHTAYNGLPVFLTEAKMNFFDTMENLHGSKLTKQFYFIQSYKLSKLKIST